MMSELARTPLYDWHRSHGGRLVEFAGWWMPVQYTSIVDEHQATRSAAGVFDISHMGRLRFRGPDALPFLERLLTRRVTDLRPGGIRYSLVTNHQGGILDDVLLYCLPDGVTYFLVVNASNRPKILQWLSSQRRGDEDVDWDDETMQSAMIAVQGPRAMQIVEALWSGKSSPSRLRYYSATEGQVAGSPALVSRTGYTGEDGCEIITSSADALHVWRQVFEQGTEHAAKPAGLGARDTLRLEAGMPLYGHELSENINPLEADLSFAVQLEDREFPGAGVLRSVLDDGARRRRIGLKLSGKRVPREAFAVLDNNKQVGVITSGTFSPTLNQPIAMALVDTAHAREGALLKVDIRGRTEDANIVALPFYRRR
jgi:aminomethyltransferase